VVQIFPGMITTIFFEEIETVTFLLSQNVEWPNSFQSITHLERP
jgi:hypothetical protein